MLMVSNQFLYVTLLPINKNTSHKISRWLRYYTFIVTTTRKELLVIILHLKKYEKYRQDHILIFEKYHDISQL